MISVIAVSEMGISAHTWDIPLARVPLCFNVSGKELMLEKSYFDSGWSEPLVYVEIPLGDRSSDNQSAGS